jgi:1,4-dihydroxy-2-naphthoate octaprenyltransferase
MVFLHSAANLMNDAYDFKKGLDRQVIPVSGAVVRGWITPHQALVAAWSLIAVGSLMGLWLAASVGWPIFWIGVAGVIIGVIYSWGPLSLKYHALGDLAVFLDFGVLGALGAWTVQTGSMSWVPAVWSIPISILVIGILHGNNWRDIRSDSEGGVSTVAAMLGDRGSLVYYAFLVFGPFAFVAAYVAASPLLGLKPPMPWTALLVLPALFLAVAAYKKGARRMTSKNPMDFLTLDGATAQLNLLFSVLYTAGVALGVLLR